MKNIQRNILGRFVGNKIYQQYYCIECNTPIHFSTFLYGSKLCKGCGVKKSLSNPKNHGKYKDGFYTEKRYCVDCGKELKGHNRAKYCRQCSEKYKKYPPRQGEHHCMFGKSKSIKTKLKISKSLKGRITKDTIARHHLDLNTKNNSPENIFILTNSTHQRFHRFAYHYLVEILGMEEVLKYKDWFTKKYLQNV